MVQSTIYDLVDQKKHIGQEVSYRNSNSVWKQAVNERMNELIDRGGTFTADDVIIYLDEQGIVTHDNRALGAVMAAFARTGAIESTGTQVKCRRKKRHSGYVTLWRVKS